MNFENVNKIESNFLLCSISKIIGIAFAKKLGKGLGADYIILGALLQPLAVHYTLQHVWLI